MLPVLMPAVVAYKHLGPETQLREERLIVVHSTKLLLEEARFQNGRPPEKKVGYRRAVGFPTQHTSEEELPGDHLL